jgi:hypothetical protein
VLVFLRFLCRRLGVKVLRCFSGFMALGNQPPATRGVLAIDHPTKGHLLQGVGV